METSPAGVQTEADAGNFDWPLAYDGEHLLQQRVAAFLSKNSFARRLAETMRAETGTDFFEWIDHLILAADEEAPLRAAGFVIDASASTQTPAGELVLHHPRATLPRVMLQQLGGAKLPEVLALRPEFVADFVGRQQLPAPIEGTPWSGYRRVTVAEEPGTRLDAVERHAYLGFKTSTPASGEIEAILRASELWQTRRRSFGQDAEGFAAANRLLDQSLSLVGRDRSCELFFRAERVYWESRNRAARIQKFRQDQMGLGWGNQDHHTFRSSREYFVDLMAFLERLGMQKRERYYAGAEAGWGAQIWEHPATGIVVFADVDLMPEETRIDFSRQRLPAAPRLGTVGLWVGLHGESFLTAGMHHLEARFDYQLLREQLEAQGIKTMNPFSNFDFLRQAFTEGERWMVQPERVARLLHSQLITPEQAARFRREGAIGSHLENLQRHGGFKGFNQKSVSVVIAATDPRMSHF